MDYNRRILPFYMAYPNITKEQTGDSIVRDLEYLQQMYPIEIKRYQKRVAELLDRVDYEGSMIYDEYPDRYTLERLARSIVDIIQNEAKKSGTMNHQVNIKSSEKSFDELYNIIFILLNDEVLKRRHGGRRSFYYR